MFLSLRSVVFFGLCTLLTLVAWQLNHAGVVAKITLLVLMPCVCVYCLVRTRYISSFTLLTLLPLAIGVLGFQRGVPLNAFLVDLVPFLMFFTLACVLQYAKAYSIYIRAPSAFVLLVLLGVLLLSLLASVLVFKLPLLSGGRIAGPLGSAVLAIYLLAILLPFISEALYKRRLIAFPVVVFLVLMLMATKARMPLGAFVIGVGVLVAYYIARFSKRVLIPIYATFGLIVFGVFGLYVYKNGFSLELSTKLLTGRDYIWWVVQQNIETSHWLGFGFGHSFFVLSEAGVVNGLQPHSEYFRVLHNQGLIGLLSAIWFVFFIVIKSVRLFLMTADQEQRRVVAVTTALWASFLCLSLTDNVLIYPFYMIIMCWFTASVFSFGYSRANAQLPEGERQNER